MTKVESYNQCCETENIIDEKISKVLENGTAKEYDNLLKEKTKIKQIKKGLFREHK